MARARTPCEGVASNEPDTGKLRMVEKARLFEGKKFMWDGVRYESEEDARRAGEAYASDGFEVETLQDEGTPLIYTRREVKEATIE